MNFEIIHLDDLSAAQIKANQALADLVYPPNPSAPKTKPEIIWAETMWRIFVWEKGELVAHVGTQTRNALHNDRPILIGGFGAVKTHPAARGKGYARAGLAHAIDFLTNEQHVDFSLLVCRDPLIPFYQKLGWRLFEGEMLVDQPSGKQPFTFNRPMVIAGKDQPPLNGTIDLCGLPW
ncbi:MAG: GNAT family N-acetyltransferase [Anaerolineae bacterium]